MRCGSVIQCNGYKVNGTNIAIKVGKRKSNFFVEQDINVLKERCVIIDMDRFRPYCGSVRVERGHGSE